MIIPNAVAEAEKLNHSYIGGSVQWHSHLRKEFGSFLENKTCNYHMTQKLCYWAFLPENENLCSWEKTSMQVFIAVLFPIVKKKIGNNADILEWLNSSTVVHLFPRNQYLSHGNGLPTLYRRKILVERSHIFSQ